jgi:DNA invertase Pin-like site-specific DNA recombinase
MPEANELTIHVLAAVAQAERKMISTRVREALAAAKARGRKLGGDRGNLPSAGVSGRLRSIESRKGRAADRKADLLPHVEAARAAGHTTLAGIAAYLNGLSIPTARGGTWHANSVRRLIA